jgi:hypothetical protein
MTAYEHQAVDHNASIRAERPDPDQVRVTITVGEDEPTSITMWAEDFETMAREVLPTVVSDCDGDEWTRKNDGLWWMNRGHTARAKSSDLNEQVGPLTVVSTGGAS